MTALERERKHQKSIVQAVPASGSFNPHSFDHRADLAEECAYRAVQTVFGWLSIDQMKQPSRRHKDAQLARQVAIRIMAVDMNIEQRHITRMQGRQRTSIHFAIRTVEQRMEEERFAAAYEHMASFARRTYEQELARAA